MRDLLERTESSASRLTLAAAATGSEEKRPGGCVGVLFQLFDWNRRFAKKKILPKRLLPLASAKQASKKFIADEKLPKWKHLRIAEENSGGFPTMKKNFSHRSDLEKKKQEMRAPGLVARLMGLETLPALSKRPKSDEGSIDESCNGKCESFSGDLGGGLGKEVSCYENGSVGGTELRPQKMQKTGLCVRHQMARFGVDTLQMTNVMSRPRKHHHKLASPAKSPRVGRSTSSLIGAATKILEPGLQATSRAKCAIRYSNSVTQSLGNEAVREAEKVLELPNCGRSDCSFSRGQSAGKKRRDFFEDTDVKFVTEEQAPTSDLPSSGVKDVYLGISACNPRLAAFAETEKEVVLFRSKHPQDYFPSHVNSSPQTATESVTASIDVARKGLNEWHSSTMMRLQNDESNTNGSKKRDKVPVQKEMLLPNFQPRTRIADEESRRVPSSGIPLDDGADYVAFRGRKFRPQLKPLNKIDNLCEAQRKSCMRADESFPAPISSARKRGSSNAGLQSSDIGSSGMIIEAQRGSMNRTAVGGSSRWLSSDSTDSFCARNGLISPEWKASSCIKDIDVVSFSFSSPLRSKDENISTQNMNERKRSKNDSLGIINRSKLPLKGNCVPKSPQSSSSPLMNQDALGALLDQKLKELTRQVEEESVTGVLSSTRTTASILQELIAALTAANPTSVEYLVKESPEQHTTCPDEDTADTAYQPMAWTKSPNLTVPIEGAHFSPGSVVEAPFSNESCISSSTNDASDAGILDSPSYSKFKSNFDNASVSTHSLDCLSMVLQKAELATTSRLTKPKIDYMNGVLHNTVILLSDIDLSTVDQLVDFILGPVLDELDTYASTTWNDRGLHGYESAKGDKLFKGFLLDCVLECLELRYRRCLSSSGYEVWSKLQPVKMDSELLVRAVKEEFIKWSRFAGKQVDEMIEMEMSTSLGKWTDFKIEGFEMGSEMGVDIVQTLVDEIVIELLSGQSF